MILSNRFVRMLKQAFIFFLVGLGAFTGFGLHLVAKTLGDTQFTTRTENESILRALMVGIPRVQADHPGRWISTGCSGGAGCSACGACNGHGGVGNGGTGGVGCNACTSGCACGCGDW